jgi:hypothetical protein
MVVLRIVPKPADRLALVQQQYEQLGHFGVRRTAALLLGKYWWHGLLSEVSNVISSEMPAVQQGACNLF